MHLELSCNQRHNSRAKWRLLTFSCFIITIMSQCGFGWTNSDSEIEHRLLFSNVASSTSVPTAEEVHVTVNGNDHLLEDQSIRSEDDVSVDEFFTSTIETASVTDVEYLPESDTQIWEELPQTQSTHSSSSLQDFTIQSSSSSIFHFTMSDLQKSSEREIFPTSTETYKNHQLFTSFEEPTEILYEPDPSITVPEISAVISSYKSYVQQQQISTSIVEIKSRNFDLEPTESSVYGTKNFSEQFSSFQILNSSWNSSGHLSTSFLMSPSVDLPQFSSSFVFIVTSSEVFEVVSSFFEDVQVSSNVFQLSSNVLKPRNESSSDWNVDSLYSSLFIETFAPTTAVFVDSSVSSTSVLPNVSSFEVDLMTKILLPVDVENKTDAMKEDEHLTVMRPSQVQQEVIHGEGILKDNKPYLWDNFEKSLDPNVKIIDVPLVDSSHKVESKSNESEVPISSSIRNIFMNSSVVYNVESSITPSLSSSFVIYPTQLTQNAITIINLTSSEETSSTEKSATFKLNEKELITKVEESEAEMKEQDQSILPTVLVPTAYLSVTMRCTWPYFCSNQKDFQKTFAKHLTAYMKSTIADSQIVFFNINPCNQVSLNDNTVSGNDAVGTISLSLYVEDRRGAYSKALTELLGLLMVNKFKGPNENIGLQDVVLAVQLHRKADPVEQHQPQTNTSNSNEMGIIAAVTISCIAGFCLLLLCVLLIVLKRRHGIQQQRRCRPVADAYSLESISIYSSFCKRKLRASKRSYLNQGFDDPNAPSHRLNFAHLAQYSTDENAITEEYKEIPMTMAKLGEMPVGSEVKNRYANVIPFPETRVQLTPNPELNSSDYINANYVRGFQGKPKHYIACQAPLETTIADFWQMIWENQCKVVIMLTSWDENGVSKCAQYFSESNTINNHRLFGDYQITTKMIDVREYFTITNLQLKNLEKNLMRDVVHFWFTAWPVQGVPTEKVSILEMLLEARSSIKSNSGPTVVHCSPGTGRTGTILALDICMQEFELTRTVDVPRCVYHLRRDRGGLVQTTEQYFFIYEVLNEFACRVMNQSGRSSVRSSK